MSFSSAVAELDACEIPVDAAGLASAVLFGDRYTARLVAAVGEFDAAGEWEIGGWTSPIAWLRELGLTYRDASELVKLAAKLRRLPVTAAAWIKGALTGGQVRAIAAAVIERHVGTFAEHEAELVPAFTGLSVDDTIAAMRLWRERADALDAGKGPRDDTSEAWLSPTLDNRGHLHASLDAEGFALAESALAVANSSDLDVAAPLRRGQALKDIFRYFLDNQTLKTRTRNHPQVLIMVKAETLGTDHIEATFPLTGMAMPQELISRYLCDCELHKVMTSDGVVLDYGRAERTPPADLFAALVARDHKCRWKGCDRPAAWCHAHHVLQWDRDHGITSLGNLVLLCERHHGRLHRKGWSAVLHPNGDFEVSPPTGPSWTTHAPGTVEERIPKPNQPPPAYSEQDPFLEHHTWVEAKSVVRAWAQELTRLRAA
jgi:hypothetical protein